LLIWQQKRGARINFFRNSRIKTSQLEQLKANLENLQVPLGLRGVSNKSRAAVNSKAAVILNKLPRKSCSLSATKNQSK
jgi:hypothetical protein